MIRTVLASGPSASSPPRPMLKAHGHHGPPRNPTTNTGIGIGQASSSSASQAISGSNSGVTINNPGQHRLPGL